MSADNTAYCELLREWLADGDADTESLSLPPAQFASHLAECAPCAAAWAEARRELELVDRFLTRAVPPWRADVPRVSLTAAVLARLAEPVGTSIVESPAVAPTRLPAPVASRRWSRSAWAAFSGLVALVAMIALWPATPPRDLPVAESAPDTQPTVVVQHEPAPGNPSPVADKPFRLSHLLVDANAAWNDLAEETAETVGDVVALSRPATTGRVEPGTVQDPSIQATIDAGPLAVPVDWIPLRKQMGGALEYLRESLREEDTQGPRAG